MKGASVTWTASAITLAPITSRPRHTKFSSSTVDSGSGTVAVFTSSPTKDNSGVAYYRYINSKSGTTCILLKTDAIVEIKFKLHNLEEQGDSFIPEKVLIEGDCKNEDYQFIRIEWTGYSLVISFAKTPGGERWYINNIKLTANPDLPQFHGIALKGKQSIELYHKDMLIPTPVGRSYSCDTLEIPLETDKEDHPPEGVYGTLYLRKLQVQPFMYKGENFEQAFECKDRKFIRDETAPIAVGSTLAIAVVVLITGYAVYRYLKVKNVQYNTME
ncbi:hypothetical protein NQ315_004402 [Exocentrus adspersus]|uniref:Lysosome-associated membrane glycoprotein 5 n=1 Tax=Exocentrus adspersus TaxID=1586481 RepID=A0AAV8W7V5_9CUCU|nr:hypothetical protein NQ315_004402 [Exocentrus adspersus]